jgi:excisionase family DNA binding protein
MEAFIRQKGDHTETQPSGFLKIQDIANYLGIKTSTLYSMVEEKKVPHYRIGRLIRFKKSEIDEWMGEQKEGVVDVKMEAKKVIRSIEKRSDLDLDRIMKKAIEQSKKKGYNFPQEKPGGIEGLETEVNHGLV